MIYMEPNQLGLNPPIISWLHKELPKNLTMEQRQLVEVGWNCLYTLSAGALLRSLEAASRKNDAR